LCIVISPPKAAHRLVRSSRDHHSGGNGAENAPWSPALKVRLRGSCRAVAPSFVVTTNLAFGEWLASSETLG
jgi:hypothetical protein